MKTVIWIAVSVYVLVAIVRKRLALDTSLYQILQILSVTLFEENAHFTGSPATILPSRFAQFHQSTDSVPFIAGQLCLHPFDRFT